MSEQKTEAKRKVAPAAESTERRPEKRLNVAELTSLNLKISLKSRLLHALGCACIGTPESLNMPPDFYYLEGDRKFPAPGALTWTEKRRRLYVDHFRRNLMQRTAVYASAAALAVALAGAAVNGGIKGAAQWVSGKTSSSESRPARSESRGSTERLTREECNQRMAQAWESQDERELARLEKLCR